MTPEKVEQKPLIYLWRDNLSKTMAMRDDEVLPSVGWSFASASDVTVRADYMPYVDERCVNDIPYASSYTKLWYDQDNIRHMGFIYDVRGIKIVREAYLVSHFNMRTYGHFLMEVLPKLFVAKALHARGMTAPILLPTIEPWMLDILETVVPEMDVVTYDPKQEVALVQNGYIPTLPLSVNFVLHPDLSEPIQDMSRVCYERALATGLELPESIFLTRQGIRSFRKLSNETELGDIARQHGFSVINPLMFPWWQQVAMFHTARNGVGEFSSALHNAMFSFGGRRVLAFNYVNSIQASICRTVGNVIGYI